MKHIFLKVKNGSQFIKQNQFGSGNSKRAYDFLLRKSLSMLKWYEQKTLS